MATCTHETLVQQIVACTPDGVIFADGDGVIRFWNAGAEAIFGYAAPEAVGRPLELIIPEQLRARHNEGYRRVMETGMSPDPETLERQLDENPGLWVRLHPNVRSLVLPDVLG